MVSRQHHKLRSFKILLTLRERKIAAVTKPNLNKCYKLCLIKAPDTLQKYKKNNPERCCKVSQPVSGFSCDRVKNEPITAQWVEPSFLKIIIYFVHYFKQNLIFTDLCCRHGHIINVTTLN